MKSKDQKTSFLVNLSENIQCLKINHPKFFSESSCDIYLQVLKKKKSNPTRRISRTKTWRISTKNVRTEI